MADIKRQLDQIIWDKWSKGKKAELKPSELGWSQDAMPWKAEFKHNAADDQPFVYRAEGKYISFKPTGLWWTTPQGSSVVQQGISTSLGSLVKGKVKYANVLGAGIGLEASVSRTTWRKEITIESLARLGTIPNDAEFLEIGFEIETDFNIESWDGISELQFTEGIRLGELSQIEPIKVRDSSIIPEPKEGEAPGDPSERCSGFLRVIDGKSYLIKQIPVDYLRQAVYPIITDIAITFGAKYAFDTSATSHISCARLDATHFVVCYADGGDAGHGKAKVGVVTGDAIAYGSEYEFKSSLTNVTSCAALDATHFVVCYGSAGSAKIGVVSNGDQIAYGDLYSFNVGTSYGMSCAALDATHFVVGYRDWNNSDRGTARIGVVTGDVIVYGSEYVFNNVGTYVMSCAALDSTHFVVCYEDAGGDTFGHAKIGVVSGTPQDDIAYGAEYTFNADDTSDISCAGLDPTHFVVGYRDHGGTGYGESYIGVVTGDAIAYGAKAIFNTTSTSEVSCARLDATHFVVCYEDAGGDWYGEARIGVVSGSSISYGSKHFFNETETNHISCAALDSTHFVVGYRDEGSANYGEARIGTLIAAPTVTTQAADSVEQTTANPKGNVTATGGENPTRYIDYDVDSGTPYANSKDCGVGGVGVYNSNLTGLIPGKKYYYRAKAVNLGGTGTGVEMTFTTKSRAVSANMGSKMVAAGLI